MQDRDRGKLQSKLFENRSFRHKVNIYSEISPKHGRGFHFSGITILSIFCMSGITVDYFITTAQTRAVSTQGKFV